MDYVATVKDHPIQLDVLKDEVEPADRTVGILAPFVTNFKAYRADPTNPGQTRELTQEEYDSISEEEHELICDALTETLSDEWV